MWCACVNVCVLTGITGSCEPLDMGVRNNVGAGTKLSSKILNCYGISPALIHLTFSDKVSC